MNINPIKLQESYKKSRKPIKLQESYKKSRKLYNSLKKEHFGPLKYHIHNSDLIYTSVDGLNLGISKGTSFQNLVFPNFYRIDQKINSSKVTTFRVGMTNNVTKKDLVNLSNIIYNNRPVKNDGPSLIVLSLLGLCNTKVCKIARFLANMHLLPQSVGSSLNEDHSIRLEQLTKQILPLFIPIRPQSIKIGPIKIGLSNSDKIPIADRPDDTHHTNLKKLLDLSSTKNMFRSIVDIGNYYYSIRDQYNLLIHCRSSKDRSGVVDSILHATFNCIVTKKKVDYNYIRKTSKDFLSPSLIIAYFSTGIYGLKLKQLSLAHYILSDKELHKVIRVP